MRAGFDKSLIAILWLLLYYLTHKGPKGTNSRVSYLCVRSRENP